MQGHAEGPEVDQTLRTRHLGVADAAHLHQLLAVLESEEQSLFRTSLEETRAMLERPDSADVIGVFAKEEGDDSAPVAFAYVGLATNGNPEAICHGGVRSQFRDQGIGAKLLEWQQQRGVELLAQAFPGVDGRITHVVNADRTHFHELLEELGYMWVSSLAEMRCDLPASPLQHELPNYVELVPWTTGWDGLVNKAYRKAARETDAPVGLQEPSQLADGRDQDLSFLAVDRRGDRAKVVGLVKVALYSQDWDALGWKEGAIDAVASFTPEFRAQTLGPLVSKALAAMARAGLDKAAVSLDPYVDAEMMEVYEQAGFSPHVWWRHYECPARSI